MFILVLAFAYPFIVPEFITFSTLIIMYSFVILPFIEEEQFKSNYLNYLNYYLPINKSSFIIARYLMLLIAILLSVLLIFISSIIQNSFNIESFMFLVSLSIFSSILLRTLAIPCFLKFGGSLTRNLFIILTVGSTFISSNIKNSTIINKIFNLNPSLLSFYIIIISIVLFISSLLFSIQIYNKKELKN